MAAPRQAIAKAETVVKAVAGGVQTISKVGVPTSTSNYVHPLSNLPPG